MSQRSQTWAVISSKGEADVEGYCSFTEQIALPDTPGQGVAAPLPEESKFYVDQIKAMKDYELTTLYVDFGHLLEREEVLARAIQSQYYRLVPPCSCRQQPSTDLARRPDSFPTFAELFNPLFASTNPPTSTPLRPSPPLPLRQLRLLRQENSQLHSTTFL